jgi:hypothetical protein
MPRLQGNPARGLQLQGPRVLPIVTVKIDSCDSGVTNTFFSNGCTIADLVAKCAVEPKNHGDYVSCAAQTTQTLLSNGSLTPGQQGRINSCAARSTSN